MWGHLLIKIQAGCPAQQQLHGELRSVISQTEKIPSKSPQTGTITRSQWKALLIIDDVPGFCQHNFSFLLIFITLFHGITISCVSFSLRHKANALFVDSPVENSIQLYKNIPKTIAGLSSVCYNVTCGIFVFFPLPTPSPPCGEGDLSGRRPRPQEDFHLKRRSLE